MFNKIFKPLDVFDKDFESLLAMEILVPTEAELNERREQCLAELAKVGLNAFSPNAVLANQPAGRELLRIARVSHLRDVMRQHGWARTRVPYSNKSE